MPTGERGAGDACEEARGRLARRRMDVPPAVRDGHTELSSVARGSPLQLGRAASLPFIQPCCWGASPAPELCPFLRGSQGAGQSPRAPGSPQGRDATPSLLPSGGRARSA